MLPPLSAHVTAGSVTINVTVPLLHCWQMAITHVVHDAAVDPCGLPSDQLFSAKAVELTSARNHFRESGS
jgi:hypothetical protein